MRTAPGTAEQPADNRQSKVLLGHRYALRLGLRRQNYGRRRGCRLRNEGCKQTESADADADMMQPFDALRLLRAFDSLLDSILESSSPQLSDVPSAGLP